MGVQYFKIKLYEVLITTGLTNMKQLTEGHPLSRLHSVGCLVN